MQVKANTYYFSKAEKKQIKKLVDKKYGKISTPIDYDSSYGEEDMGMKDEIYRLTGKLISGSTLERLVGLTGNENAGVRLSTVEAVSDYLGFSNARQFAKHLERAASYPGPRVKKIDLMGLFKKHVINIGFGLEKYISIRNLSADKFEVLESRDTKIRTGDQIVLLQMEIGDELICSDIIRRTNNRSTSLGRYRSGFINPISTISFHK